MANTMLVMIGIAVLSVGTWLMRFWRRKARQQTGAVRTLSGAVV